MPLKANSCSTKASFWDTVFSLEKSGKEKSSQWQNLGQCTSLFTLLQRRKGQLCHYIPFVGFGQWFGWMVRDLKTIWLGEKCVSVSCSVMSDSVTPWTVAHQASLSMGFLRQEHQSGLPFPSPRNLPDPGIKLRSATLQADSLPSESRGASWGKKWWQGNFGNKYVDRPPKMCRRLEDVSIP